MRLWINYKDFFIKNKVTMFHIFLKVIKFTRMIEKEKRVFCLFIEVVIVSFIHLSSNGGWKNA